MGGRGGKSVPILFGRINGEEQQKNEFEVAKNVAAHFFYLISTNYSMQAYIDADYRYETLYSWQPKKNEYGEMLAGYEWHREETGSWINSVFHKNDGYMCPIVLNPYRNSGQIDMAKEAHLTTNRLCALLLQSKNEYQIVEGYRLAHIIYRFNQRCLLEKKSLQTKHLPK